MRLFGLEMIVNEAVARGTLHGIAPPPMRGDYPTAQRYEEAVRRWERTQLWTVTNIGETDEC